MKTLLTPPQRIGLGIVAVLYGELTAAPLFIVAILLRFPSNFSMLVHSTRLTLEVLLTDVAFEGLISSIAWFIFGSALVCFWAPEKMRAHKLLLYCCSVPLGLSAPLLLAAAQWRIHQLHPELPLMHRTLFLETFCFMLVSSAVALYRYVKMSVEAEELLASGGEFRF